MSVVSQPHSAHHNNFPNSVLTPRHTGSFDKCFDVSQVVAIYVYVKGIHEGGLIRKGKSRVDAKVRIATMNAFPSNKWIDFAMIILRIHC